MSLSPGTTLGPYRIDAPLGAGGMGEVYKATDTRLSRTVAIKVLPRQFAADPDMRGRFEREAKTIAGLNHPNICTLHDVGRLRPEGPAAGTGTADEVDFLVMEFVEGETLADRLARGPLAVDDALRIAAEIVDALDRAHRQGVVHRDLKPANIMLAGRSATRSGQTARPGAQQVTKLLDFGLAKWTGTDDASPIAAQPTRLDVTAQGTMVGTLQYMAPEQVEGREADARTDLFAFGAVLYEMLTGRKAFEGKSQASLIGAIMKAEPRPISHAQPLAPAAVEHLVARCLAKDPDERWQGAQTLKRKLAWIIKHRGSAAPKVESPRQRRLDLIVTAAIAVLFTVAAVPASLYWRGAADPEPVQFRHTISGLSEADVAVSPDGRTIAFVAKPDNAGTPSLYTRPVGGLVSVKLAGTDNASQPFWSPDSRFIAFASGGKLKKVTAEGGAPKELTDVKEMAGGAWSAAQGGTIIVGSPDGIFALSAEGGQPARVTDLGDGETGHLWPTFFPDGRAFAYLAATDDAAKRAIVAGALDAKTRTPVLSIDSNPVYASGHLFFRRGATLFAQPFDAGSLAFAGDPVQVAGEVATGADGRASFSVSRTGVLLYYQGTPGATATSGRGRTTNSQFNWAGRRAEGRMVAVEPGFYGDMDLSPDGRLVAVTRQDPGSPAADIWVIDWDKALSHRVTNDPVSAIDPVWSPDGARIAFTSYRRGNADIYVKNANGVGEEKPLLESPANESVEDWSRDGRHIALLSGKDANADIWALPLANGQPGKPFPVVQGPYQKNEPQFSKDGRWLAYTSDENETGRFQVYVISFPSGELKQQISTEGGGQPRWSWDGRQVFYRTLDNRFMVVDLKLGARIDHAAPRVVPIASTTNPTAGDPTRHMWSIASDGRMLVRAPIGSGGLATGAAQAPVLIPFITPGGQGGAAPATRSTVTSGLTAILHWPSMTGRK